MWARSRLAYTIADRIYKKKKKKKKKRARGQTGLVHGVDFISEKFKINYEPITFERVMTYLYKVVLFPKGAE